MSEGRFARLVDRSFTWVTGWYGRRLDRSLDFRPAIALLAVVMLVMTGFLFAHTRNELAPEEAQGVVFAFTKAPQYANLDYVDVFGDRLDQVYASFPETDTRFVINGFQGLSQGFAGMILKPWDERTRSAPQLKFLVQPQLDKVEGVRAFPVGPPPLPGL